MAYRIAKVNKHLQRTFSDILQKEAEVPAGVLVTVARAETKPNLRSATIWLYISPPERAPQTMEALQGQMYELQGSLNRQLETRPLPYITLKHDTGIDHAEHIKEKLAEIKDQSGQ